MKYITLIILVIFVSLSCTHLSVITEPDLTYDAVIDSSFYCEIKIGDTSHKFNTNGQPGGISGVLASDDSLFFGFSIQYVDTTDKGIENIRLQVSKTFNINDLEFKFEVDEGNYACDNLSNSEFISIFQQEQFEFSSYSSDAYRSRLSTGVDLEYENFWGSMYNTSYCSLHLPKDSINEFYKNSDFEITGIEILSNEIIIVEGSFNVDLFNWVGSEVENFNNGYFKAYVYNFFRSKL